MEKRRARGSHSVAPVVARIRDFNAGREEERLRMKFEQMAKDPFTFFRGTCHLFYEDWPTRSRLNEAPLTWICGDLHFENFGAYKGDNRLVYFDLNDFDESVLAPCTWDVTRFLTSLRIGARGYQLPDRVIRRLCGAFLDGYRTSLERGKSRWVERETSQGIVRQLLQELRNRTESDLLDKWTTRSQGQLRIRTPHRPRSAGPDQKKQRALEASRQDKATVRGVLKELVRRDGKLGSLRMLDAARRVAGTGSLGLERYVALVEGPMMSDGIGLLDIKIANPSALEPYVIAVQPRWRSPAERIVTLQARMQAISPALLTAIRSDGQSYVIRELQPSEDRLDLEQSKGKVRRLESVATTMGCVVAWAHLRGSARQGAAGPEDLVTFARNQRWTERALAYAESYADRVQRDWEAFRDAMAAA